MPKELLFKQPLVLGSSSKSRHSILVQNNISFTSANPDIDEYSLGTEYRKDPCNPTALVSLIAKEKANALIHSCLNCILVTCDQVILYNGKIREKPSSEVECRRYLESYAIHPAISYCGVYVVNTATGKSAHVLFE